ncbi:squalene/phytoene synthase family protein [Rhodosalinus sediminis]|uniref:squalene/phytoene synthase family protein n=1 Tax=Rhodosalinus sediminis TaxID=1940533 RepID=UPI002354B4E6|nr:squalene/phytoene synthase family protein [Rhodosalinus sediminis]
MAGRDDLGACAELVRRGDPDRFRAAMAAPPPARGVLFPLYAFNLEVARAPWVVSEPMLAEIRLQWWREALEEIAEGQPARRHEVVQPLARALDAEGARLLDTLVAARRADLERAPFADEAALWDYLDATAGTLHWVAARALGAAEEGVVRAAGQAQGLAAWLSAVPELEARGRLPLPDGRGEAVARLAKEGLARLGRARKRRAAVSREARAALIDVAGSAAILARAAAAPARVAEGRLAPNPLRERLALIAAASGRW